MANATGTATSVSDLLNKLYTFVTNNGWTSLDRKDASGSAGEANGNGSHLWIQGNGSGAGMRVYLGFRVFESSVNNHYCLELKGATGFTPGETFENHPSASPTVYLCLYNNSMNYWVLCER